LNGGLIEEVRLGRSEKVCINDIGCAFKGVKACMSCCCFYLYAWSPSIIKIKFQIMNSDKIFFLACKNVVSIFFCFFISAITWIFTANLSFFVKYWGYNCFFFSFPFREIDI
jgi:hypothetical protein